MSKHRIHQARRPTWILLLVGAVLAGTGLAQPAHPDVTSGTPDTWVQEPKAVSGQAATARARIAAAIDPGASTPSTTFTLTAGSDLSVRIRDLDAALPKQGVQSLLSQANRTATSGSACAIDPFGTGDRATPLAPAVRYCFENDDSITREWIPQAVTGVSDAQADETWGTSSRPVLVGWYDKENPGRDNGCTDLESDACNEKGVRITFLDPSTRKYRHVLLVWPYYNRYNHISFDAVHADENPQQNGIHAGGMVWYGNYLYVADTMNGLRVFDMRYIMDLNPDQDSSTNDRTPDGLTSNVTDKRKIGRQSNVWYSYGYRYVMPQVATWKFQAAQYNGTGSSCWDHGSAPKASYLGLDRSTSPDRLIVGEYCRATSERPSPGRIGAWPLDGSTGELQASGSTVYADSTYYLPVEGVQGVARYDGIWYINQSHLYSNGSLYRAQVGNSGKLALIANEILTAVGPEDLYYQHGAATGEPPLLWSVSEHRHDIDDPSCYSDVLDPRFEEPSPCGRVLYAHEVSDILAQP